MKHSSTPKIAAIHDLSCFGRAALTVVIPILSRMGIQVCPLPTAVLSTHGQFSGHSFVDFTEHVQGIIEHWNTLNLCFDAIYSGYLGSAKQIEIFSHFIQDMSATEPLVVIDPVLGDHGKLYGVSDKTMLGAMREYIGLADVITPNLTEAAFLLDEPYKEFFAPEELQEWLQRLSELGPENVIITSLPDFEDQAQITTLAYDRKTVQFRKLSTQKIPANFPGTGDAFTSVLLGSLLQDETLPTALVRAVQFLFTAILATFEESSPECEGIILEKVLNQLDAAPTMEAEEMTIQNS